MNGAALSGAAFTVQAGKSREFPGGEGTTRREWNRPESKSLALTLGAGDPFHFLFLVSHYKNYVLINKKTFVQDGWCGWWMCFFSRAKNGSWNGKFVSFVRVLSPFSQEPQLTRSRFSFTTRTLQVRRMSLGDCFNRVSKVAQMMSFVQL
jgi:hypothetical protein